MRGFLAVAACGLCSAFAAGQAAKADPRGVEFFEKKIRPVLVQDCYQCHSEEARKNKKLRGGLLLDSKAGVLKGGESGAAVIPGKAKDSLLVHALRHQSDLKMPPKGKLTDDVVADFVKWIDMGAPDPRDGTVVAGPRKIDVEAGRQYWAFRPLSDVAPPAVKMNSWVRTPLDRFVLARLEEKKLAPNPVAGREKLIRRAYYDLLGMPPPAVEVEAFIKDTAADAYERLIDRLLQSEHYGERWARHWLDLARFAESGGYEFDKDRPAAYHYRDFVIKTLNQDMPYDEFVRLQLAGDHLKPNDVLAVSATGFLVAGPYPGQITAKTRELIRYNHLDDMVSTLGSAMLGLSVGCARCHDHKYDPIAQEDYYRLIACLGRTDSADVKIDSAPEIYRQAKADFDLAHAPLLAAHDRFEKDQLPEHVQKLKDKPAPAWIVVERSAVNGQPKAKMADTLTVQTYLKDITAIRFEAVDDKPLPTEVTLTAAPLNMSGPKAKPTPVKLKRVPLKGVDETKTLLQETEGAVGFDGGTVLTFSFKFKATPYYPRIGMSVAARPVAAEGTELPQIDGEVLALLAREKGEVTAKNREGVVFWLRRVDSEAARIYNALEQHAKLEPQPKLITLFAAASGKGGDVHFLVRGEVEKKDVVPPGFVQVLMQGPDKDRKWTGTPAAKQPAVQPRIALANWLTDTEHGAGNLLARVIVNRLWQHHLGRGIVATANDFGTQGEAPTHPELLDYLARELIRNGWKLKPIHKLIVTSGVYMQASSVNPAGMQLDPQNRFLWRRPVRRLEAEAIRDAVLVVSNTLDASLYGPGTLDAGNPRRSIYLRVKRSQMVPFMQIFDTPEAMQSIGERTSTTVPTQSLAFLNSPLVRKSAEKFSERIRPAAADRLPEAIDQAYLLALARQPTTTERERMLAFVRSQAESYGRTPQATNQALNDFCQVMLCLNEFVFVD